MRACSAYVVCCTYEQKSVSLQHSRVALRCAEDYRDRVVDVVDRRVENADKGRELGSGHRGILVVVPETLHRLRWAKGHTRTQFFYYRAFKDLHLNRTDIFSDVVGTVVFVLPDKEPKDAYYWTPFIHAVDLWLIRVARIVFVNGPRFADWNAWNRLNERARESIAAFWIRNLSQVVSLLPEGPGATRANMACFFGRSCCGGRVVAERNLYYGVLSPPTKAAH
ncbi:unnamed protein product [Heligmosomoides polygyrus]|uniref:Exostosin domain-containing protein n=1 Tax=Heligmosomoides polygyrus TaxID=6339 RepID=A0A183FVT4_HELPZ|nr:unnamed protein product [Heligmosomoides polygyrus]